jgi:hypothetical protein
VKALTGAPAGLERNCPLKLNDDGSGCFIIMGHHAFLLAPSMKKGRKVRTKVNQEHHLSTDVDEDQQRTSVWSSWSLSGRLIQIS